jgi:bacterioferritin-associated ferredoxin
VSCNKGNLLARYRKPRFGRFQAVPSNFSFTCLCQGVAENHHYWCFAVACFRCSTTLKEVFSWSSHSVADVHGSEPVLSCCFDRRNRLKNIIEGHCGSMAYQFK